MVFVIIRHVDHGTKLRAPGAITRYEIMPAASTGGIGNCGKAIEHLWVSTRAACARTLLRSRREPRILN
jgi:hypothetical protein